MQREGDWRNGRFAEGDAQREWREKWGAAFWEEKARELEKECERLKQGILAAESVP